MNSNRKANLTIDSFNYPAEAAKPLLTTFCKSHENSKPKLSPIRSTKESSLDEIEFIENTEATDSVVSNSDTTSNNRNIAVADLNNDNQNLESDETLAEMNYDYETSSEVGSKISCTKSDSNKLSQACLKHTTNDSGRTLNNSANNSSRPIKTILKSKNELEDGSKERIISEQNKNELRRNNLKCRSMCDDEIGQSSNLIF